ncbi:hypothetical protein [Dyadobacter tibetensis]|uniref:hypothetical protein n=1 Tax=Dyadobacter tibetensis TaxID=1211851 RepID=UPI00046FAAF7|nr:hypothetical protein [Dyadobacter tibetensis]
MNKSLSLLLIILGNICIAQNFPGKNQYPYLSGIYPHLAYYNNEGECGTGAVVPWANKLWVITYGPHKPMGSSDRLYEIDNQLNMVVRPESIGGTPANRMIHRESQQLFIGPYAIDQNASVRTIPYSRMPGRHTGNARHLSDPANKIYYGTMEEGFYEVNVHDLSVKTLYTDGNFLKKDTEGHSGPLLPGAHGKGLYSGQGVMVFSNNGESGQKALKHFDIEAGVLAEWNGQDWKVVRRNQFVEVTGPGGIEGNKNPDTDPIWATGWDHKSVLLGARYHNSWSFYRLPKASHTYDGAHGWNTEWPRIRDVGTIDKPDYLMTMHGLFWDFPSHFNPEQSAGIRPKSAYLKVIGDFTRWHNGLVFGCDDSAEKEFLNKRKAKGSIEGPGQSNSNLWFTDFEKPNHLGPNTAQGALWISEEVLAYRPSDPFLFSGWTYKTAWIKNEGSNSLTLQLEVDKKGDNKWSKLSQVQLKPGESVMKSFTKGDQGEWIRATPLSDGVLTFTFNYSDRSRFTSSTDPIFQGLATTQSQEFTGGLLFGLGKNSRKLGVLAHQFSSRGLEESGYYELDSALNLTPVQNQKMAQLIREQFRIPEDAIKVEESSVLIIDDLGRRWRLPLGSSAFDQRTRDAQLRVCREVATERDLLNAHGTFYELPAENADGYAKIRPVASHGLSIHDYASYRGLLVMTGVEGKTKNNKHIISSEDGKAQVWAGTIDDLWKLGKPTGRGGPWKNTSVQANVPSDPYLIGFYDQKKLQLSHQGKKAIEFQIEVNPIGHGPWMEYKTVIIQPGKSFELEFPSDFEARWIRFTAKDACVATAWLTYQ